MTASVGTDIGAIGRVELQGGLGNALAGGSKAAPSPPGRANTLSALPGAPIASGGRSGPAAAAHEQSFQSRWESMLAALVGGDSAGETDDARDSDLGNLVGTDPGARSNSVRRDALTGQKTGKEICSASRNVALNSHVPVSGAAQVAEPAAAEGGSKNSDLHSERLGPEKACSRWAHSTPSRKQPSQTGGQDFMLIPVAFGGQQSNLAAVTAVPAAATLSLQSAQSPEGAQITSGSSSLSFLKKNTSATTPEVAATTVQAGAESTAASVIEEMQTTEQFPAGERDAGLRVVRSQNTSEDAAIGDPATAQSASEGAAPDEGVKARASAKKFAPPTGESSVARHSDILQQPQQVAKASTVESGTARVEKEHAGVDSAQAPGAIVAPANAARPAAGQSFVHGSRNGTTKDAGGSGTSTAHVLLSAHSVSAQTAEGPDASMMARNPAGVHSGAHVAAVIPAGTEAASAAASPHETFAALDEQATTGGPTWVHAGPQRAEAGFQDPALGWVGVRAEFGAGGVHAAIVPGSAEAAQALGGQMTGVSAHLAAEHIAVHSLSISSGNSRESADSQQSAMQPGGGQQQGRGQQGHGRDADQSVFAIDRMDARAGPLPWSRDGADSLPEKVLSAAVNYGPSANGRHVSVVA